jgi:hypothetical protein
MMIAVHACSTRVAAGSYAKTINSYLLSRLFGDVEALGLMTRAD